MLIIIYNFKNFNKNKFLLLSYYGFFLNYFKDKIIMKILKNLENKFFFR